VDAFRYFFLREGSFGQDWDYTDDAMVRRFNSDLANDLGNLVSRALTMAARYGGGAVPPRPEALDDEDTGIEVRFQSAKIDSTPGAGALLDAVFDRYEALDYAGALSEIWSWIGQLNQRIVAVAPWELAKDPSRRRELDAFLYRLLEAIRIVAVLSWPVIPRASARIFRMLGMSGADPATADLAWGRLEPRAALGTIEPLFPRIDTSKETIVSDSKPAAPPAGPPAETTQAGAAPGRVTIDIEEFARLDLRVARVLSAEPIKGSKKLLKLQVDLGDETRQIVSGIADAYAPESLVGRKVVLVANLKPAKLMGVESAGMVLAASLDGKAVLCTFDTDVPAGTKVK
jgi:methionyl-tRNA synthetase